MSPKYQNTIQNQEQVLKKFKEYCSIYIQKIFRGYLVRKKYKQAILKYKRFRQLLVSIFMGWKVRRIFQKEYTIIKIIEIKKFEQ